ncbi:hypothetical protein N182_08770 [Sinorhizobium sp. GL2]|jgi:hypothetical protein|nr:hypothetical protein N182_08770 [Sinorhizobium sp. GL2]
MVEAKSRADVDFIGFSGLDWRACHIGQARFGHAKLLLQRAVAGLEVVM